MINRVVSIPEGEAKMQRLPFTAGDIVSAIADDGTFRILKILAVDEEGLYTKLFAQQYAERPRLIKIKELSTPPIGPVNFPLAHARLASCNPEVIAYQQVTDEELEDYRAWLSEEGRYL
jgi:hypothetical protein